MLARMEVYRYSYLYKIADTYITKIYGAREKIEGPIEPHQLQQPYFLVKFLIADIFKVVSNV